MTSDEPEIVTLEPKTTAIVRGAVPTAELADFFDQSFGVIGRALAAQGVSPIGPAFGLYYGPPTETADLEVGFPTDRSIEPAGSAAAGSLPGGRAARWVYAGGFLAAARGMDRGTGTDPGGGHVGVLSRRAQPRDGPGRPADRTRLAAS